VIDITLNVLIGTAQGTIKDGVSYAGPTPNTNTAQPGHKLLNGQSARSGPATFPFLADPN
jgi:hypothetical protein